MKPVTAVAIVAVLCLAPASAAASDPVFAGTWSAKDPGGVGGLFYGLTWDQLVARWKELGAKGQYLADVEVYEVNGQERYAALWRVGSGHGALLLAGWNDFVKVWKELLPTQELIDLEIIGSGSGRRFLGVWRRKQSGQKGSGALFVDLTWDQLVAHRKELGGKGQYLADVEIYLEGNKWLFAGVWRIGQGNGALYLKNDWADFAKLKQGLNKTQEMLDFEMFQAPDGTWSFLGVWRVSDRAGPLHASTSNATFEPLSASQLIDHRKRLQNTATLTGIEVRVPVPKPLTSLRGDTTCKYGDSGCNRCATDVPAQFNAAFSTGHRPFLKWSKRGWTFNGRDRYQPDNLRPEVAFNPYGTGKHVGIAAKHIQGFVRTNSSRFPYAGSHSHKNTGSIFIVERQGGSLALHSLYRSSYDHPSGVAVLGDGLFVAEEEVLRRFSVSASGTPQNHRYPIGSQLRGAGGGLALARLDDGTTLLVVSAPGGGFRPSEASVAGVAGKDAREDNARPRATRFYRIVPNAFVPKATVTLIGEFEHAGVSSRPSSPAAYSENVSMVAECGTGRLYTIHTTGEYKLRGNGYWRLSRVEMSSPGKPRLVHVASHSQSQHNEECHHRSSATVRVNSDGRLEFICSERAVIKWNPGRFDFTEGTP